MIQTAYRKMQRYIPAAAFWTFILTAICGVIHLIAQHNTAFADFFNFKVNAVFRAILATLTSWIPFSLAEGLLISIPVIATVIAVSCVRVAKKSWRHVVRRALALLAIVCYFYISFVLTIGVGYHATPVDEVLDLDRRAVSAEELYQTALILTGEINELVNEVDFVYQGRSVMPYSVKELSAKLCDAYESFCEKYDYVFTFESRVKPIILSKPMTYTHISGVYSYMTGESNLNVNYPDFIKSSTAAHELAHQRGFSREDEASFIAFLVGMESEDPYIRYCAYMDVYSSVMSALGSASPELRKSVSAYLDTRAYYESRAYSRFFDEYREAPAATVTDKVNNAYLQAQGTVGVKSYDMVTDLAVAYYKSLGYVKASGN